MAQIIEREIDVLPERIRQVFMMSLYEQLSDKEIADQLGISEDSVLCRPEGCTESP